MDGKLPPPNPNLPYREDCWSEGETAALVDAWGSRYLELNRGSLRQPQWREVAEAVNSRPGASARRRPPRTDIQCKNRVDTLKKKYKAERARGGASPWAFYGQLDLLVGPTLSASAAAAAAGGGKRPSPPRALPMLRRRQSPSRSPSPPSPAPPPMALPLPNYRRGSNLPSAAVLHHSAAAAAAAAAESDSYDGYNNNNNDYDDDGASQQSPSRSVSSRSGGAPPAAPAVGSKRKMSGSGGFGELARAIETFAEMYERMEAAKQRHAEEMERQRIKFLKDLELKRMQAFVDMQLQLARAKHSRKGDSSSEMLMSLAALPIRSNGMMLLFDGDHLGVAIPARYISHEPKSFEILAPPLPRAPSSSPSHSQNSPRRRPCPRDLASASPITRQALAASSRRRVHRRVSVLPASRAPPRVLLPRVVALLLPRSSLLDRHRQRRSMRIRDLYLVKLGMEVQVMDLSSDSEDEATARSPDHKRPARQAVPGPEHEGGSSGTGGSGTDSLSEQGSAATSLPQFCDAVKKGKEKVGEVWSAWAAGPPKLCGGSLDAGDRMETDSDPWSAQADKAVGGGNHGAGCWGDWGDQLRSDRRDGFQGRNGLQGLLHNGSDDHWKGILGARPADPVNTPWRSWDTGMRQDDVDMFAQGSQATHEVSGCHDILMEDSSSWLSRIEGLHFPLPDQHQLKARQIQSDEEFARELDAKLNQGLPGSQNSQAVDTAIAWTLQEQDAERAKIAAREAQSSSSQSQRDRSMAHLYSYGRHSPAQSFASWANHTPFPMPRRRGLPRNSNTPEVQQQNMFISQLAGGVFSEDMDLETRMAVLDSIHDTFESFVDPYSADSDDEYENLVVHDDNNRHRGVPEDQINNLPLSVIEVENPDELCPICLDCPSAGDSLRHLPCLHKFHKECIDRWLGMKITCPCNWF
ncbi:hypothetical protein EJB05_17476, partial [Eragrostis curvula]